MNLKYFKKPKIESDYVSYELHTKSSGIIKRMNNACFSLITNMPFTEDYLLIRVIIPKEFAAYEEPEIIRWISDLNEIGFACSLIIEDTNYLVDVNLSEYTYRGHLFSTLSFIRYLYHAHQLNHIPDYYFQLLNNIKEPDKFIVVQLAHSYTTSAYYSVRHSVRSNMLCAPLSKEKFFKVIKKESSFLNSPASSVGITNRFWIKGNSLEYTIINPEGSKFSRDISRCQENYDFFIRNTWQPGINDYLPYSAISKIIL